MPETPIYKAPTSRFSAGFRQGKNVDIVGVTGSIPVTPTIQALENPLFSGLSTYFPVGSMNLSQGEIA